MPPIGEKIFEVPPATEEELLQSAELHQAEQELYGVMQALVAIPDEQHLKFLPFAKFQPSGKSAVAEYPLPGEPEFRKMRAWVTREADFGINETILRTQVVEEVKGQTIRKKNNYPRAWTEDGELYWKNNTSRDLTHEEKLTVLGNIGDTLALIAQANQASREQ